VSSSPSVLPELSLYQPTALQFPSDGQEIESTETPLSVAAALAARIASTPAPQLVLARATGFVAEALAAPDTTTAQAATERTRRTPSPIRTVE
jgi:hypothetical protein